MALLVMLDRKGKNAPRAARGPEKALPTPATAAALINALSRRRIGDGKPRSPGLLEKGRYVLHSEYQPC